MHTVSCISTVQQPTDHVPCYKFHTKMSNIVNRGNKYSTYHANATSTNIWVSGAIGPSNWLNMISVISNHSSILHKLHYYYYYYYWGHLYSASSQGPQIIKPMYSDNVCFFCYRGRRWRTKFPSTVHSQCLSVQGRPWQLGTRRRLNALCLVLLQCFDAVHWVTKRLSSM